MFVLTRVFKVRIVPDNGRGPPTLLASKIEEKLVVKLEMMVTLL